MNDSELAQTLVRLAVAAIGGLAVGIEREWSAKLEKKGTRFGGVRTFLLLGLLGGIAPVVGAEAPGAGLLLLGAGAALVAFAYLTTAWRGAIDATTEVAGVVVLAAGALAGTGQLVLASAVFATVALVLVEKSRMHAAVERLRSEELEAAARFAVLALVILPLLPARLDSPWVKSSRASSGSWCCSSPVCRSPATWRCAWPGPSAATASPACSEGSSPRPR